MKEDYLWDGSGEPDREVQQLEQALARLRFERNAPPPLRKQTPDVIRRRPFTSYLLAAAAAIALMMTAGVFWTQFRRTTNSNVPIVKASDPGDINAFATPAPQNTAAGLVTKESLAQAMKMPSSQLKTNAHQPQRTVRRAAKNRMLTAESKEKRKQAARELFAREQNDERERGLVAKENLILALRIASSELRDVHKLVHTNTRLEIKQN